MLPPQHHPDTTLTTHLPRYTQAETDLVRGWLAHVEAGRIGGHLSGPAAALLEGRPTIMSSAELAVQRHNEMLVLGHAPSFAASLSGQSGAGQ